MGFAPKRALSLIGGVVVLFISIALVSTSCGVALKSPVDLIQKPKLIASQQIAREVIDANVPVGAKLVRPLESKNLSSVGSVDWNGDGEDEVYAFYSNEETLEAGVMILSQHKGSWRVAALLEEVGIDISFAEFVDLNLDKRLDVVMGLAAKDDNFKSLVVFEWQADGTYKLVHKDVYSEIRIEDMTQDERKDIIVFKLDRNEYASVSLFESIDNKIVETSKIPMDAFVSGYYNIQFGKVTRDINGFMLDFTIGSKSATNILRYHEGDLALVFDDVDAAVRYKKTLKNAPIACSDVDGDGIIEIGNRILPTSYDERYDDPPYLNTWYQWDGEDDLNLVLMNYIDDERGFQIDFPQRWTQAVLKGEMTLIRSRRFMNRHFVDVYLTPEKAVMYKLFSIEILDTPTYEERITQFPDLVKLAETETAVYAARNISEVVVSQDYMAYYQAMLLNPAEMRSLFSLKE